MASTVRLTPGGGSGGGEPPSDEPPDGDPPAPKPPDAAAAEPTGRTGPSTLRAPLASGAAAGSPATPSTDSAAASSTGDDTATVRWQHAAEDVTAPLQRGAPDDATATIPLGPLGRPRCPECGERFSRGSRFCAFDGARLLDAMEDVATDPLVGRTLGGKYNVLRPIGEGGMGTVYEVRHTALDRKFALKILRPEIAQNGEHIQRFLQEAKAAAAIGHPNIVSVSDFGEHELHGRTVPFIVMELLRGTSLATLLKEEKVLSARRAAKILAGCADALAAAHEAGVIHRDLKPDNIFLSGDGGEEVKVLDFGVAKMQGASKRLTKIGMVFGTPHYMSPEQARGQTIDHRADIYALGVILYECLCGHVPFEADTSMGVLTKQIFANPEPIERVAPDPTGLGVLAGIVMRCLAKEPDDRFASMEELAASLRMVESDPVVAGGSLGAPVFPRRPGLRLRQPSPVDVRPSASRTERQSPLRGVRQSVSRTEQPPASRTERPSVPRSGVAIPRASRTEPDPASRSWSRLVLFAAAAVALLGLFALTARTFLFDGGPAGGANPPASVPSAPSSQLIAAAPGTGVSPAAPPAPALSAAAPPAASAAPPAASATSPAASATSPASGVAEAPASGARTTSSLPPKSAPTGEVLDPWSRPRKPAAGTPSGTIVDPWAKKK